MKLFKNLMIAIIITIILMIPVNAETIKKHYVDITGDGINETIILEKLPSTRHHGHDTLMHVFDGKTKKDIFVEPDMGNNIFSGIINKEYFRVIGKSIYVPGLYTGNYKQPTAVDIVVYTYDPEIERIIEDRIITVKTDKKINWNNIYKIAQNSKGLLLTAYQTLRKVTYLIRLGKISDTQKYIKLYDQNPQTQNIKIQLIKEYLSKKYQISMIGYFEYYKSTDDFIENKTNPISFGSYIPKTIDHFIIQFEDGNIMKVFLSKDQKSIVRFEGDR